MIASRRIAEALSRVATMTSVVRTRSADEERRERHGGENVEVAARLEAAAERFEQLAQRLEATV
jgi:hypothetical protein